MYRITAAFHDDLCRQLSWYRAWHEYEDNQFVHWSALFAMAIFFATPIFGAIHLAHAASCTITAPTTVTDRTVHLTLAGCAGVRRFQVSESPDFTHPSGVQITVSNMAADKSAADVSVTYKNGVPGGNGTAYALPPKRNLSVLAVLYEYADDTGKDNGVGAYETPTWLNRFVFGDGVRGYDGYHLYNSFKDHIYQSTDGRVTLTGMTYPKLVHIPLEHFRTFLDRPNPNVEQEIIAAIRRDDPTFFDTHSFDYMFPYASSHYAADRGYNSTSADGMPAEFDSAPWDKSTSIFANTIEEVRTAHDATHVVPLYNAYTVEGVWLASDTAHTGTNYFTGGSQTWDPNIHYSYITLGTPLPTPTAQVIVRYKANAGPSVDSSQPETLSNNQFGDHFWHENYHVISGVPQMNFGTRRYGIGDPYVTPYLLPGAVEMMTSNPAFIDPLSGPIDVTPLLAAVAKYEMGYAKPYTLVYGQNETGLHIVRTEFTSVSQVENNTTMIKVPLRKLGDPGIATKQGGIYYTDDGIPTTGSYLENATKQYTGEEYLLIELRSAAPLANGRFNFDEAIKSSGVYVYHVIEPDPYLIADGGLTKTDVAELVDATPPYLGGVSNTVSSGAALGPDSNVYSVKIPEFWQEKPVSSDGASIDYLLSEGRGPKTLYARYVDTSGNALGTQTITINLDSDRTAAQNIPTLSTAMSDGYSVGAHFITATYNAPNGIKSLNLYIDNYLMDDRTLTGTNGSYQFSIKDQLLPPGAHTLKVVARDAANIAAIQSIAYSGGTSAGPQVSISASPLTVASGQKTTITWSSTGTDTQAKCTGIGFGSAGSFGASVDVYPYETTTFKVSCTDLGMTSNIASVTVTVTGTTTPPADTTRPVTAITAPVASSTVSATTTISATAADNVGVTKVEFYKDGTLLGADTASPYSYLWGTTADANGTHALQSKAYDAAGNIGTSTAVSVTVNNVGAPPSDITAPITSITSPLSGATVSGTTMVSASASDNMGVTKVELYKDGSLFGTDTASPYSFSWSTAKETNASHALQTKAYDAAGNVGSSGTVSVIVANTTASLPAINFTASSTSITQGGSSVLTWSASGATICTSANFNTGNQVSGTLTVTPAVTTTYTITCTGAGGSATKSVTVTVTTASLPTATLAATPDSVLVGASVTLTWTSTGATSCTGSGFATGGLTGGSVSVTPSITTTYSISCSGAGGASAPVSATVTVTAITPSLGIGARVQVTAPLNVRAKPNTKSGAVVCTEQAGILGTIIAGPSGQQGYTWWQVSFDNGCTGYVVQDGLALAPVAYAPGAPVMQTAAVLNAVDAIIRAFTR